MLGGGCSRAGQKQSLIFAASPPPCTRPVVDEFFRAPSSARWVSVVSVLRCVDAGRRGFARDIDDDMGAQTLMYCVCFIYSGDSVDWM